MNTEELDMEKQSVEKASIGHANVDQMLDRSDQVKKENEEWVKVNLEYGLADKMDEIEERLTKKEIAQKMEAEQTAAQNGEPGPVQSFDPNPVQNEDQATEKNDDHQDDYENDQ